MVDRREWTALDRDVAKRIRTATYFGQDLVDRPRRMALMNLYLHNIEPQITLGDAIYEPRAAAANSSDASGVAPGDTR